MGENQDLNLAENLADLNKMFLNNIDKLLKEDPHFDLTLLMNNYILNAQKFIKTPSQGQGQNEEEQQEPEAQNQPQNPNQGKKRQLTPEDAEENANKNSRVDESSASLGNTSVNRPVIPIGPSNPPNPTNTPPLFYLRPISGNIYGSITAVNIPPRPASNTNTNLSSFISQEPRGAFGANPFPTSYSSSPSSQFKPLSLPPIPAWSFTPTPTPPPITIPPPPANPSPLQFIKYVSTAAAQNNNNPVKLEFSYFFPPAPTPTPTATPTETESGSNTNTNENKDKEEEKEDEDIYTVKCNLFRYIHGTYKDGGEGVLFIKKLKDGIYQIIVRDEKNPEKILLEMEIKNGLLFTLEGNYVRTADPSFDPISVPMLIRLKDAVGAEQLIKKIHQCQYKWYC